MPHLWELTAVPAGWPLETVLDAFVHLAMCNPANADAQRALEALAARLVELWAARPAEAAAWRGLNADRSRERLAELLLLHWRSELSRCHVGSFSEAGLERVAGNWCFPPEWWEAHIRPRCSELAARLAAAEAEAEETARKRQKVEEKGQEEKQLREEKRQLGERLEAAEAELHSAKEEVAQQKLQNAQLGASLEAAQAASAEKQRELQAAKHECGLLAERLAAAEATLANKARELQAAQDEGVAQKEWCEQLAAEASGKQRELQKLQADCDKQKEHCEQLAARLAAAEAVSGNKLELKTLLENAALQERGDLLGQLLAKAEEKLGQMQEEKGAYKERCRQLACQLAEMKGGLPIHDTLASHGANRPKDASSPASTLAEDMGYTLVQTEGQGNAGKAASAVHSSGFSVQPGCFMLDAVFKCRSSVMDFYLTGKDLRKGSQVVAGDGENMLEVVDISKGRATEVVSLEAGAATLHVTPDHPVQVPDKKGEVAKILYEAAAKLVPGDLVVLNSGEPAALTSIRTEPNECEVLKVVFEPDLPVAVFSCPPCILSKGQANKPPRRGGMCRRGQADETADGGVSMPDTAAGEYMD